MDGCIRAAERKLRICFSGRNSSSVLGQVSLGKILLGLDGGLALAEVDAAGIGHRRVLKPFKIRPQDPEK